MQTKELTEILEKAVARSAENEKEVAIAFSGGLDSATIAKIGMQKFGAKLIAMGVEGSHDLAAAREAADELGLPLYEVVLDERKILQDYEVCYKMMPGTLTDVELMVGAYECCKKAQELGCKIILFGSGAEENFIGYQKYYNRFSKGEDLQKILNKEIETLPSRDLKRTCAIAGHFGIKAAFPFMDKELVKEVASVPVEKRMGTVEMKKPLLRKIAKSLGVPKCAYERPKKAMQYGSDIHRILLRHAKAKNIEFWDARAPFVYE
ncbi:hypothetical protein COU37_00985 [Candidatus Micrarchaeota archaeon CG10_big_fil_rev_8_21_14_0_10_45_29]|nr:MAG: hypothetical protein COU37_00985 [Candidatus Micrarchaeota archaeon CG10_big_fil_rev_8_21_14_0_10_45_29]